MTEHATPPQLAASGMAATDAVDADPAEATGVPALGELLDDLAAAAQDAPKPDAAGAERALAEAWCAAIHNCQATIARLVVSAGATPDTSGRGLVRTLRQTLSGKGPAEQIVSKGNPLIDHLSDAIEAAGAPEIRTALDREKAVFVTLVNRAQDRIDGET